MAVLAPMPNASESVATATNKGLRASPRSTTRSLDIASSSYFAGGAGSILRMAAIFQPSASFLSTNVLHMRRVSAAPASS